MYLFNGTLSTVPLRKPTKRPLSAFCEQSHSHQKGKGTKLVCFNYLKVDSSLNKKDEVYDDDESYEGDEWDIIRPVIPAQMSECEFLFQDLNSSFLLSWRRR